MDGNDFLNFQGGKRIYAFHHVIRSSRVYEERIGLGRACHESMTSFFPEILILVISLLNVLWKIDVVSLEKRGQIIKFLLHTGMLRVEALPTVRTLEFLLSLVSLVLVFL